MTVGVTVGERMRMMESELEIHTEGSRHDVHMYGGVGQGGVVVGVCMEG